MSERFDFTFKSPLILQRSGVLCGKSRHFALEFCAVGIGAFQITARPGNLAFELIDELPLMAQLLFEGTQRRFARFEPSACREHRVTQLPGPMAILGEGR